MTNRRPSIIPDIYLAYSRLPHSSPFLAARSRAALRATDLPPQLQALAILLPKRGYATETSTQGGDNGPPPGFNIDEAKKPLPKDQSKKDASSAPSVSGLKNSDEQTSLPRTGATSAPKTKAAEEASLTDLAASKATEITKEGKQVAAAKEEQKKLTLGQKIKKEVAHYWDGTKLLATEVKISTKLALKMAAGYELSRRENRQVSIGLPSATGYANTSSSNVQYKILAVLSLFLSSSSSLSPSCFYRSPSSSSRIYYHPRSKVRSPKRRRLHVCETAANKSHLSSATLCVRPVFQCQPCQRKRRNSKNSSAKCEQPASRQQEKMSSKSAKSSRTTLHLIICHGLS